MEILYYLLFLWLHPIHISKTAIDIQAQSNTLQITSHIFVDDFELALNQYNDHTLYLTTTKEIANADSLIMNYIQNALQISINGTNQPIQFVGKERSQDYSAVWLYLEIPNLEKVKNLTIHNSLLLNVHADQKNIVRITTNNPEQGQILLLDAKKSIATINFDQ